METIDRVVFLNLDTRPDRLSQITTELDALGVRDRAQRLAAVPHALGIYGCAMSHLQAVKAARDDPTVQRLLVLEDDFQLRVPPSRLHDAVRGFLRTHGDDFDVLFLAVNLIERVRAPAPVAAAAAAEVEGPAVVRVLRGQAGAAYIINRRAMDGLIRVWEAQLPLLLASRGAHDHCPDISWWPLQQAGKWFAFEPSPGGQRPSYSDIQKQFVRYGC
jgi:GR25 family glycosyltransferase involved in LPS biosynthesis